MASAAPVQVGMASAPPQQTQGAVQVSPGPPPTAAGVATPALDAALQGATCLRLECTAIDTYNSMWTAALRLGDDASAEPAFTLSVEGIGSLKGAPYRAALWPAPWCGRIPLLPAAIGQRSSVHVAASRRSSGK